MQEDSISKHKKKKKKKKKGGGDKFWYFHYSFVSINQNVFFRLTYISINSQIISHFLLMNKLFKYAKVQ
jgi:midasin (ATPase involved in ribosome maturation)